MWWNMHGWWGGWWGVFGFLWMLLFWGGIILLTVWGINRLSRNRNGKDETPLEIAQRRYARGEITRDEFESIKATLTGANPATGQGRG